MTKDEIIAQAVEKNRELEVALTAQKKDIESLQRECVELKAADKENTELKHSIHGLKSLFKNILLPIFITLLASCVGGFIWIGRLAQRVDTVERQVEKLDTRLQDTRDRILVIRYETTGEFVKIADNRVYVKQGDEVKYYRISPNAPVLIKGKMTGATLDDLKPGMKLHLSMATSIDDVPFVIAIREIDHFDPNFLPRPKKMPGKM